MFERTKWRVATLVVLVLGGLGVVRAGDFEDLGSPARLANLRGVAVGPDSTGTKDLVYLSFSQGSQFLLVSVEPASGAMKVYTPPGNADALSQGMVLGPDKRIYISTGGSGQILRFDPANPGAGIVLLGSPSKTETYVFALTVGSDKFIYGCTYPSAKLIRVNPNTGALADMGRMDSSEMYARYIASGPDRKIYTAIGMNRQDVVMYDITKRTKTSLFPASWRVSGLPNVSQGSDGKAYVTVTPPGQTSACYRIDGTTLVKVDSIPFKKPAFKDGTYVTNVQIRPEGCSFDIVDPSTGASRTVNFAPDFEGAALFMVAMGPDGNVYGSTYMPLGVFVYRVSQGKTDFLGNMPGSEVYSMQPYQDKLYMCYYGGAVMSLYDPTVSKWSFGTDAGSNPLSFGQLGDGHYRPDAMLLGPDGMIYVGSEPPPGQLGGALAVWDPGQNKVVQNYRNLVQDQSILSLTYEPTSKLIFGGSGTLGGAGTTPTATQAVVFAFDPVKRVKTMELTPKAGAVKYQAIAAAGGKVFASTGAGVYVIDPAKKALVKTLKLQGNQLQASMGVYKGKVYGLTTTSVYCVDPAALTVTVLGSAPVTIQRGFAAADSGVYFGSGTHLWRYKW